MDGEAYMSHMKRYLVRFRELCERLDDRMLVDDGERSLSYS